MTIDPKIKARIQKLLALGSNNDAEHEADAAMKKAASLAEEYGFALSDMDAITGKVSSVQKNSVTLLHPRHNCWANSLAVVVGKCFDCEQILVNNKYSPGIVVFVGTPTDLEMALWYYKLIRLKTIRGGAEKYPLVKDQKMYGLGVLQTMRTRLQDMFKREQEKIRKPETTALVLVKNEAVQEEFARLYPNIRHHAPKYKHNGSMEAFREGVNDGNKMGLHRGNIEGRATGQLN